MINTLSGILQGFGMNRGEAGAALARENQASASDNQTLMGFLTYLKSAMHAGTDHGSPEWLLQTAGQGLPQQGFPAADSDKPLSDEAIASIMAQLQQSLTALLPQLPPNDQAQLGTIIQELQAFTAAPGTARVIDLKPLTEKDAQIPQIGTPLPVQSQPIEKAADDTANASVPVEPGATTSDLQSQQALASQGETQAAEKVLPDVTTTLVAGNNTSVGAASTGSGSETTTQGATVLPASLDTTFPRTMTLLKAVSHLQPGTVQSQPKLAQKIAQAFMAELRKAGGTQGLPAEQVQQLGRDLNQELQAVMADAGEPVDLATRMEALLQNRLQQLAPDVNGQVVIEKAPREKALATLEAILEKAPEPAKEAIAQVLTKMQEAPPPRERVLEKSVSQIQLEAILQPERTDVLPSGTEFFEAAGSIDMAVSGMVSGSASSSGVKEVAFSTARSAASSSETASPMKQVLDAGDDLTVMPGNPREIRIQLRPYDLGEVRLVLSSNRQQEVTARLITQTPHAKEALEKHLNDLTRAMEAQGIQVANVSVVQSGATGFEQDRQSERQQQQSGSGFQFNQQQQQQQSFSQQSFTEAWFGQNAHPFKDGGSPRQSGGDASSIQPFDKDVEGGEVMAASDAPASFSRANGSRAVDIRI